MTGSEENSSAQAIARKTRVFTSAVAWPRSTTLTSDSEGPTLAGCYRRADPLKRRFRRADVQLLGSVDPCGEPPDGRTGRVEDQITVLKIMELNDTDRRRQILELAARAVARSNRPEHWAPRPAVWAPLRELRFQRRLVHDLGVALKASRRATQPTFHEPGCESSIEARISAQIARICSSNSSKNSIRSRRFSSATPGSQNRSCSGSGMASAWDAIPFIVMYGLSSPIPRHVAWTSIERAATRGSNRIRTDGHNRHG
jgi:hypothetical protein